MQQNAVKKKPKEGISLYIGVNLMGLEYPVFYDPHFPISINRPSITTVTGSPGSGKTFAGLTFAAYSSLSGKITFVIDPKGDFIALKGLSQKGDINDVQIWTILDSDNKVSNENQGMLDPTLMDPYDPNKNVVLTADIIAELIGGITPKQQSVLIPIIQDVCHEPKTASFAKVVQKIKANRDDEIRSLGFVLDTLLRLELSKLLVRNRRIKRRVFEFDSGTVVASLLGLEFPSELKNPLNYTGEEKVSIAIVRLLTSLVLEILKKKPKSIQKTLIIDEAWTLMGNSDANNMITNIGLLGRSLNMAGILITQSPSHLEPKDETQASLDTTISTRFAFRNDDSMSNVITCDAMNLPEREGWEEILPTLGTGQCFFQDCQKQMGIVQIRAPYEWQEAFNTNPADLIRVQRQEEERRKQQGLG